MVNKVVRFTVYTLLYIPIELTALLLLINLALYKLLVFTINTYYYYSERNARLEGLPYTTVAGYQDLFFNRVETASNLSYNTLVCRMGRRLDAGECKRIVLERVLTARDSTGRALFPKLRQVFRKRLLFSTWTYDSEFSVHNQITEVGMDFTTEDAVEKFVGDFEGLALPVNRPQWHCYFLSDPRVEDVSYIVLKFHHSICDGASVWKLVLTICDNGSQDEIRMNKLFATQPTPQQRKVIMLKTFIMLPIYLVDFQIFLFNHSRGYYTNGVSGEKRVAWSNKLDFEKIREIKKKTKTSVNDVIMTILTEAMRRYFIRHDRNDVIANDLVFAMGVALSGDLDDQVISNKLAGIYILTPTSIEGPFRQLEQINENMNLMKQRMWPFFMELIITLILTLPCPDYLIAKVFQANVRPIGNYTNVPGPVSTLTLNGVPLVETYGIVMTSWYEVMGISFITYKGRMHVALKVDRVAMENPRELIRDIEQVLDDMHSEIS